MRGPTQCSWCETPILDGQPSTLVACGLTGGQIVAQPWHEVCLLRSHIGSPAHLLGGCDTRCHGDGSLENYYPQTPEEKYAESLESRRLWKPGYS